MASRPKSNPGRNSNAKVSGARPSTSNEERKAKRAEAVATMKREQSRRQLRSRLLMAAGVVVAIAIVAGVGIYVGLTRSAPASAAGREAASAGVADNVTSVPASVFDEVGTGTAMSTPTSTSGSGGSGGDSTPLTVDGKPYFLYVGAEYCPYCAAERWAMAASLSRFGTFSGLKETESSATDVFPSTRTLSFYKSTYTSDYVTFKAVETQTNTGAPLETLAGDDAKIEKKYNYPPYVSGQGGAIPFVDIANQYVSSGATFDAQVLQGKSHAEIAEAMQDPGSDIAQAVDGAANLFTAAICTTTNGQPGAVCDSSGVQAATTALSSGLK